MASLVNDPRHGRAARFETGWFLPLLTVIRIDWAVLAVENMHLVMAIGLGEKYAELSIGKVEIDRLVSNFGDGIIPPGDGLLFVQHPRDAMIERVFDERALGLGRRLVGGPAGIGDDRNEDEAEEGDRDPDGS